MLSRSQAARSVSSMGNSFAPEQRDLCSDTPLSAIARPFPDDEGIDTSTAVCPHWQHGRQVILLARTMDHPRVVHVVTNADCLVFLP